jgi:beta-1,3-galactosyltransferase 1
MDISKSNCHNCCHREIERSNIRDYLLENLSKRGKSIESSEEVDIKDEFELNPEYSICNKDEEILFIAFVVIAPSFFEKRNLIRSTYGNNLGSDFKLVFSVGMSKDEKVNKKIREEYLLHKDIIQTNSFVDSYFLMTKKIIKSFKWTSHYCSNAKYVLRINDDVILNKYEFINYFKRIPYKQSQIYGNLIKGSYPRRDINNKFFVEWREYPLKRFPWYVDGKIIGTVFS